MTTQKEILNYPVTTLKVTREPDRSFDDLRPLYKSDDRVFNAILNRPEAV